MHDEDSDSVAVPAATVIQAEQLLDGTQRNSENFRSYESAIFKTRPCGKGIA
jgi:hypothetical protein